VVADGAVKWIHRASELQIGSVPVPVFRAGIELNRLPRFAAR